MQIITMVDAINQGSIESLRKINDSSLKHRMTNERYLKQREINQREENSFYQPSNLTESQLYSLNELKVRHVGIDLRRIKL